MKSQPATVARGKNADAAPSNEKGELSPRLKELQGSFALEGVHISDERLLEYAGDFETMKNSGEVRQRILQALGKRP